MSAKIIRDAVYRPRASTALDIFDIVIPANMSCWPDYGIIDVRGALTVVSKKEGRWKTRVPNSSGGFNLSHRGESYYYNLNSITNMYEAAMHANKATSVSATSHKPPQGAPCQGAVISTGVVQDDAIIYNIEKEMTQFVRRGTSYNDINALVVRRGFPQTEKTLIMFLGSRTIRPLYTVKVVTTTVFAL